PLYLVRGVAVRPGPTCRRSRPHLSAHIRARRAVLVVVVLHAPLPASPAATNVSRRRCDRGLYHRSWGGLGVLLLGPRHLRAEELWPCRRRHRADHVPCWIRCLPPRGCRLRSNVERAASRTRLPRPRRLTPAMPRRDRVKGVELGETLRGRQVRRLR